MQTMEIQAARLCGVRTELEEAATRLLPIRRFVDGFNCVLEIIGDPRYLEFDGLATGLEAVDAIVAQAVRDLDAIVAGAGDGEAHGH